ncbi:phosphate ABC transporter substrate-binding protein PstS [soil metagenome]
MYSRNDIGSMAKVCNRNGVFALTAVLVITACGGDAGGATSDEAGASTRAGAVMLTGAGATFPFPLYSKWFSTYSQSNQVRVNYQSIGSGGGIRQLTEGTVDFGASDAPMNEEELTRAPGTLHFPTVAGAVAVTYNLPELSQPVRIDGTVLGDIFLGTITRWNDPRLQALNPGVQLPARDILVVHRTDGSGTTYVFTDYLNSASTAWQSRVGMGKAVRWPTGLGGKGNEGVAGQVRQTPGAIGYVEQVYAQQNNLSTAAVMNRAGEFVQPTIEATVAAASAVADQLGAQGDFRVSIVNAEGAGVYPISAFTYLLIPQQIQDCTRARAMADLTRWALTDGGTMARELGFAPLPDGLAQRTLRQWDGVTCGPNNEPLTGAS